MKGLSIKYPWTNKIYEGEKSIETRTWKTNYRGMIVIVESLKPVGNFPGQAVAIAQLIDVRPMTVEDEEKACCAYHPYLYSWVLTDVKKIVPFKVQGKLGFYDIPFASIELEVTPCSSCMKYVTGNACVFGDGEDGCIYYEKKD